MLERTKVGVVSLSAGDRKEMGRIDRSYAEYDPELGLHHSPYHNCHPQGCSCVVVVQVEGNYSRLNVTQFQPRLVVKGYCMVGS